MNLTCFVKVKLFKRGAKNTMTYDGILSYLKTENLNISLFDCVSSTNTLLKEMAINGEKEGKVIIALSQSAGRGRYDRKFYSDKGGIYMSILLRPQRQLNIAILTAATAVAVSDAIEEIAGKTTQIKWVNDILVDNKKVCGILCEGGFIGNSGFVVVGIGINAYQPENGLNHEIDDIAGTVFGRQSNTICEKLTAKVIDNVFYQYKNIEKGEFLDQYRQKNIVLGRKVDILKQGEIIDNGEVLEIDDNCHLTVCLSSGEIISLSSGEVSVRV